MKSSSLLPIIKLSHNCNGELNPMTPTTPFPPDSLFNPDEADYIWPELSNVDWELFGPFRATVWNLRQADIEAHMGWPEARPDIDEWLALNQGDLIWGPNPGTTIWA
ncbi:hypothetical protein DFS33DRAFT_1387371 [Desarmillaria ectypa]|nr:hypothetical protein DFS33DRAFT_1387371 [Desarmillaria ectypa]